MSESAIDPSSTPEEKARLRFLEDSLDLLDQPTFRRWLWHVIDHEDWCAAHACREDTENIPATFVAAGMRRIGVALTVNAQACSPKLYQRMLAEAQNLKIERAAMSPQSPQE